MCALNRQSECKQTVNFLAKVPNECKSWGVDEVMYSSRKFGKDYLQGRLRLLGCDNITWYCSQGEHLQVESEKQPHEKTSTDLSYQHIIYECPKLL